MLLVDALYINNSGGLELLKVLIDSFSRSNINVFYLLDIRVQDKISRIFPCTFVKASLLNRYLFYAKNQHRFHKIFCFGNIPPPIRTDALVYTYFHNINLLKIPHSTSLLQYCFSFFKQQFICSNKNNTNYWIVQTANTKEELKRKFKESEEKILIYPFWKDEFSNNENSNIQKTDYVYIANYTPEKQHLLLIRAWRKLHALGYNLFLHLTLTNCSHLIKEELLLAQKEGVNIINHGTINKEQVISLYECSKATVYTSLNESFGLGIIEALLFRCDVIAPNLPYIHTVCTPSSVFSTFNIDDIVNAIIAYEKGMCMPSSIKISNELKHLIYLLK